VIRKINGRILMIGLYCGILSVACHHTPNGQAAFPASNQVSGWSRTGEIRTFPAVDLWKYIDGDAERYEKAGVHSVSTADYKFRDKFDVVADIYTMTSADSARQIFESEPSAGAKIIQIGDASRLYGQSLTFRKGPFLVRITAYADSTDLQSGLVDLGRGIEHRLR
jgi:hypothetical protein